MRFGLNRPYRYDYFIIWGNGLHQSEAILDILRGEEDLELIKIVSHTIRDMKRFVFDLYACDTVPMWHLQAKLSYLFQAKSEAIFIFAKNLAPEEEYVDDGPFRHLQCQYIARVKERIRNLYNPRKDGKRTEEHVIHASDQEMQVDYFLKMLGFPKGVHHLHSNTPELPVTKPYHIPNPDKYRFKKVAIEDLRASILVDSGPRGANTVLRKIHDTPHFLTLQHGGPEYGDYLKKFRYTLLTDNYSQAKFREMGRLSREQVEAFDPVLVTALNSVFQILDGVHRAAVSLFCGCTSVACVEFDH